MNFNLCSEYEDNHKSKSVYVGFPLPKSGRLHETASQFGDGNASLLIWTTTPWTLPSNVG